MATRIHKALSMMPEDLERLQKLSAKAGMSESQYIRSLLKVQEAKLEGREDGLRIMSDKENKESPSGDDEGGQGREEARFLTKKIPNSHWYINVKIRHKWYWCIQGNEDTFQNKKAVDLVEEKGWEFYGTHDYLSTDELLEEIKKETKVPPFDISKVEIKRLG